MVTYNLTLSLMCFHIQLHTKSKVKKLYSKFLKYRCNPFDQNMLLFSAYLRQKNTDQWETKRKKKCPTSKSGFDALMQVEVHQCNIRCKIIRSPVNESPDDIVSNTIWIPDIGGGVVNLLLRLLDFYFILLF